MSRPKLPQTVRICCRDELMEGARKWVDVQGRELRGGVFALTKNNLVMGITHIKTGFLVQNHIPSLAAAEFAAKRLMALDVDWSFDDPDAVKSFSSGVSKLIHKIRRDAFNGVTRPRESQDEQ